MMAGAVKYFFTQVIIDTAGIATRPKKEEKIFAGFVAIVAFAVLARKTSYVWTLLGAGACATISYLVLSRLGNAFTENAADQKVIGAFGNKISMKQGYIERARSDPDLRLKILNQIQIIPNNPEEATQLLDHYFSMLWKGAQVMEQKELFLQAFEYSFFSILTNVAKTDSFLEKLDVSDKTYLWSRCLRDGTAPNCHDLATLIGVEYRPSGTSVFHRIAVKVINDEEYWDLFLDLIKQLGTKELPLHKTEYRIPRDSNLGHFILSNTSHWAALKLLPYLEPEE